jgi:signal transduction histidine kinase
VHNRLARRVASPGALADAAEFSARTASEALDAVRQVVGVLGADDQSSLAPQPGLADLQEMLTRLADAGLHVHSSPEPITLAFDSIAIRRDVELAIFRITQEAMTNVLRHRGPGQVWLSLSHNADVIELTIDDDGSTDPTTQSSPGESGGNGLINMRERAEACGGSIAYGASPQQGRRVHAQLPLRTSHLTEFSTTVADGQR